MRVSIGLACLLIACGCASSVSRNTGKPAAPRLLTLDTGYRTTTVIVIISSPVTIIPKANVCTRTNIPFQTRCSTDITMEFIQTGNAHSISPEIRNTFQCGIAFYKMF